MSIPLPRAILLVLLFLTGNFLLQAFFMTLPRLLPGLFSSGNFSAHKLLLSLAFIVPLIAVFRIQKLSPGGFLRGGPPARWTGMAVLAAVLLIAPSVLVLGTELLNYTRAWLRAEEQYGAMMRFIGPDGTGLDLLGAYVTIGLVGPLCEELLFRGIVLRGLEERYRLKGGVTLAVYTQAILFALVHLNQFQFPYALAAGIVLGWLAWWTGSILAPLAAHIALNTTQITILYFFPHASYFAYKGPGIIEHIPVWWLVIAAAMLTAVMFGIKRSYSSLARSPV